MRKSAAAAAMVAVIMIIAGPLLAGKKDKTTWDIDTPVIESYASSDTPFDGRLQVIAYNIERGFFWEDVADYVESKRKDPPATVLLISESDRNHSRTGEVFVAREMARALGMNMAFVTEYIEYNDETPENQGDHGNAILSPFPLEDVTVIRHRTVYSWERWGWIDGQPRRGERVTLGATVVLPSGDRVRVYSAHLESNAETLGKWLQMSQIVEDAEGRPGPAVIGGDFNELPWGLMWTMLPRKGMENTFKGDNSPTGGCRPEGDKARCAIKIDWIVHRDMTVLERSVDYPLNSKGGVISDHCPVRAVFELK